MASSSNRRKRFFINKSLQLRFMLAVIIPILLINFVAIIGIYFGIWSKVLESFSDDKTLNDLMIASRMVEYEQARHPNEAKTDSLSPLSFIKSKEKLGVRQREIFKEILNETNRELAWKFLLLLLFVAWGTIFISHKIAGPLYRLSRAFSELEKGDFRTRVFLRKADEAKPLALEFNEAIEKNDKLLQEIKTLSKNENASEALSSIREKLDTIKTSSDD